MEPRERLRRRMYHRRLVDERLSELPEGTTAAEAARVAYEAFFGVKLAEDQELRSKCRNPNCINPEHMQID